ncbi:MAG: Uma2 family endonuclease [Bacteroidota bacterium]
MLLAEKILTYQEYKQLEFEDNDLFIYELLNGTIMRKSSPTIQHQRIVRKITRAIENFLDDNPMGEVLFAPLDVVLSEKDATQPDVLFISNEKKAILNEEEQVVIGVPDILVEVLSPGSIRRDKIDKKNIYERVGVPEFWIVDPFSKTIEVLKLVKGQYDLFDFEEATGSIKSSVLQGFELDLEKVF